MPSQGHEAQQIPLSQWIDVTREALQALDNRLGRANPNMSSAQFRNKLDKAIAFIQAIALSTRQPRPEPGSREPEER